LGITVNFQRILKSSSGLSPLERSFLDLTAFEEGSVLGQSDGGSSQIYRRLMDGAHVVVKSISLSASVERCQIETEVENLLNLRHPMIAPRMGVSCLENRASDGN
jgi:hypothetical protein